VCERVLLCVVFVVIRPDHDPAPARLAKTQKIGEMIKGKEREGEEQKKRKMRKESLLGRGERREAGDTAEEEEEGMAGREERRKRQKGDGGERGTVRGGCVKEAEGREVRRSRLNRTERLKNERVGDAAASSATTSRRWAMCAADEQVRVIVVTGSGSRLMRGRGHAELQTLGRGTASVRIAQRARTAQNLPATVPNRSFAAINGPCAGKSGWCRRWMCDIRGFSPRNCQADDGVGGAGCRRARHLVAPAPRWSDRRVAAWTCAVRACSARNARPRNGSA